MICLNTLITYGSIYGSTKHYAEQFSSMTGFPALKYSEAKDIKSYDRIIHFGALYAGGVTGLKAIVSQLPPKTELVIVTVGLADVQDTDNTDHIRKSIKSQLRNKRYDDTKIFHLRGAIDYSRLSLKHRAMMALLYAKAKNLPEEKKNSEVNAMIETYGKKVSFINDRALQALAEAIASDACRNRAREL